MYINNEKFYENNDKTKIKIDKNKIKFNVLKKLNESIKLPKGIIIMLIINLTVPNMIFQNIGVDFSLDFFSYLFSEVFSVLDE